MLADSAEGETPSIPITVMKYSIGQAKSVDINATLKMMSSPGEKFDPACEGRVDTIIRLVW